MPHKRVDSDSSGDEGNPDFIDDLASHLDHSQSDDEHFQPGGTLMPERFSGPAIAQDKPDLRRTSDPPSTAVALMTPSERFRAAGRKVIQMHRTASLLSRLTRAPTTKGFEPGIDPRRHTAMLAYGHLRARCVIQVADYSALRTSIRQMGNEEFITMLKDADASVLAPWAKVRWINIRGISWDVLSELALRYELHPLALEDILHQRGHARSKADYYPTQLFIRVLCHLLGEEEEDDDLAQCAPEGMSTRASSPEPMRSSDYRKTYDDDEDTLHSIPLKTFKVDPEAPHTDEHKFVSPARRELAARRRRERAQTDIEILKKEGRVNVKRAQMSMFLMRDGTVISVLPSTTHNFTDHIMDRLQVADTVLRKSSDPSLLVQSLLDIVVDSALDIVDAYHDKILELEHDALLKPSMDVIRRLHILSGDLSLYKRTLEPLRSVIYGLRRYDLERCIALADEMAISPSSSRHNTISGSQFMREPSSSTPPVDSPHAGHSDAAKARVKGFMSPKSKIYLADVHDHMEYILGNIEMFSGIAENLIQYTFNIKSYEMNQTMRRLTLITIICLPLTLLSGYFGMNFVNMWSVTYHTDWLYWAIALPIMVVVIPAFTTPDLVRMANYTKKRIHAWRTGQPFGYRYKRRS
ncbi:hypothetical protein CONPUDRAFT_161839 [Coniophora puteana RWD-64-598 SS2]|uniref:Cora-domain-containing protein n=1 Tax=Coniophora puteana (strain RWD-64-598) TaxID=741705 RepID=A0A5M3N743_CONPW|nr:uncharacterized protein CONPUDRAFT_161839 [Coniophora puteana RWD-64-598 SS2]EIW87253.1 hypothetical protein CONPUDRAFT_161839 [Coniophora puteana RWD-64-598 SS2]